jgi:hypothetical protein
MAANCQLTGQLAKRLGLGEAIQRSLQQVFARWDGRGTPGGLKRDDIALSARTCDSRTSLRSTTGSMEHRLRSRQLSSAAAAPSTRRLSMSLPAGAGSAAHDGAGFQLGRGHRR